MDKVRVLRVIEYVGDRKWVEETLKRGEVPSNGSKNFGKGCVIKSALIDQFPEIHEELNEQVDVTKQDIDEGQRAYMDGVGGWIQKQVETLKL